MVGQCVLRECLLHPDFFNYSAIDPVLSFQLCRKNGIDCIPQLCYCHDPYLLIFSVKFHTS